jgi:hypothetical protein
MGSGERMVYTTGQRKQNTTMCHKSDRKRVVSDEERTTCCIEQEEEEKSKHSHMTVRGGRCE